MDQPPLRINPLARKSPSPKSTRKTSPNAKDSSPRRTCKYRSEAKERLPLESPKSCSPPTGLEHLYTQEPEPFKLPAPITVPKRMKEIIDGLAAYDVLFPGYKSDHNVIGLFYLYLIRKYNSDCFLYDDRIRNVPGLTMFVGKIEPYIEQFQVEHFYVIAKQFVKCVSTGKDVIIIPVHLDVAGIGGHENVLIYRRSSNTLEHFEPHGSNYLTSDRADRDINKLFTDFILSVNYYCDRYKIDAITFVHSSQICFRLPGFQLIETRERTTLVDAEESGYCAVWSMFFTELVLKNPTLSNKEILENIYNVESTRMGDYLVRVVKGYIYYISRKIEKYYSVIFKKRSLYSELIKKDKAFLKEFGNILNTLYIVELSTNSQTFDVREFRAKVTEIGPGYDIFRTLHATSPVRDEFVATPPSTSSSPRKPR